VEVEEMTDEQLEESPRDEQLVDSLRREVDSLATTDPAADLDDLEPLRDYFEDVRVVGMGESTHGTREFFRFKHRLFRFLVEELDYRLFGIEANFSETLAIDEYVRTGEGDPREGLDGIYFWTWNTEAVLDLIEWIREFNEGRDPDEKLRFYGVDAQYLAGAAEELQSYLRAVDPDFAETVADELTELAGDTTNAFDPDDEEAVAETLEMAATLHDELDARLEECEAEYVAASSRPEFELARRHLRTFEQALSVKRARLNDDAETSFVAREGAMVENLSWILDHEDEERIALWAHDGHVRTGVVEDEERDLPPAETAGARLREAFGDDYYALALQFARGSFQAYDTEDDSEGPTVEHRIDDPAEEGLPATLSAVGQPPAMLDFESAREDDRIAEWLDTDQRMHSIGAVFDHDEYLETYAPEYVPSEQFDGLLFVDETSRSVLLDRE
jgi:erythromycin esterase